jgi:hypothetical protein
VGKPGLVNLIDFYIAMQVYFIPPYYPNQIGLNQYVVSSASATQNPTSTQKEGNNCVFKNRPELVECAIKNGSSIRCFD